MAAAVPARSSNVAPTESERCHISDDKFFAGIERERSGAGEGGGEDDDASAFFVQPQQHQQAASRNSEQMGVSFRLCAVDIAVCKQ